MPFVFPSVLQLLNLMRFNDDAVMFVDENGFAQPLAAVYRRESVLRALANLGDVHGKSMRELVSQLKVQEIVMTADVEQAIMDIDTPADLSRAIAFLAQVKDNPQL
jgi:molybdopterin-guanine dinucleotide biosynthesis protein A